ncbi:methyltransferase [Burkholderia sp. WAC0059]|uniref:RraA family protein n=1 Tax=Burkholderia sp. WAC0059 TaxID=2066022 RepID=UPI000C7EED4F|nr:methyltransferase [Burkholderia sp. WAC0059]PLZ00137.1 methyltransferase [Burkholderia sp. WAC0059]
MQTNRFNGVASFARVTPEQIERAREFQSAVLCDVAGRRGALHGSIQPLVPSMVVSGPAFPVEVRPGDNLMFHVALALAKPGDVVVVDGKGYQSSALFGELMVTQAVAARLGGLVVDGAVRDVASLRDSPMPIFANGRNPAGPTKGLDGRIGVPVSIGGVSVEPGDLVIGDCDGVVVIPRLDVDKVLKAAEKKLEAEAQRLAEIREGILVSPWLDDALRAAGVIGADETLE